MSLQAFHNVQFEDEEEIGELFAEICEEVTKAWKRGQQISVTHEKPKPVEITTFGDTHTKWMLTGFNQFTIRIK